MGEGHVIKNVLQDGKVSYRENFSVTTSDIKEGDEWVKANDINTIYILVDNNSKNTVAGVGSIGNSEDKYNEIIVEEVEINTNTERIKYQINNENYVYIELLDDEVNMKEVFEQFSNYYNERIKQQSKEPEREE